LTHIIIKIITKAMPTTPIITGAIIVASKEESFDIEL
jgi:hypothetical protein